MSTVEIYGFNRDGICDRYVEVRNAWRGAMAVWMDLEKRYLPPYYLRTDDGRETQLAVSRVTAMASRGENPMREIWDLTNNDALAEAEKIVLTSTFDNVLVKAEDCKEVIEAFRAYPGDTNLKEQADAIERLIADPECTAIGWNQTSVSADNWMNAGGYDEETEESIPYNYMTMEGHWWMFEEKEEAAP